MFWIGFAVGVVLAVTACAVWITYCIKKVRDSWEDFMSTLRLDVNSFINRAGSVRVWGDKGKIVEVDFGEK